MRRSLLIAGLVLASAGLFLAVGTPLLLGAAMLGPALALALPLWLGRYPGAARIERLRRRREPGRPRGARGTWRVLRRSAPFRAPNGPLLGIGLAVRPPPA